MQDRVAVVEGVELLGQLEGVAGEEGELQALAGLGDQVVDPRGVEDEVLEVVAPGAGGEGAHLGGR